MSLRLSLCTTTPARAKNLEALGLADDYDALLCDVWGVLHNGRTAYPGVADALSRFRAKGGHVLLLSNAPRPSDALPVMFRQMGIPEDVYDGILTSGDATKACLASHEYGTRCHHIGPERDLPLFDGTGVERTGEAEAEFLLVTGPFDDEVEGPEDYRESFERLTARDLPLICANPDIVVERGECPFVNKAKVAQAQGAKAVLVINTSDDMFGMPAPEEEGGRINIVVAMLPRMAKTRLQAATLGSEMSLVGRLVFAEKEVDDD